MLKGIPSLISPDLMLALMSIRGDELFLADAHFPVTSHAQKIIRADGLNLPTLLLVVMFLYWIYLPYYPGPLSLIYTK